LSEKVNIKRQHALSGERDPRSGCGVAFPGSEVILREGSGHTVRTQSGEKRMAAHESNMDSKKRVKNKSDTKTTPDPPPRTKVWKDAVFGGENLPLSRGESDEWGPLESGGIFLETVQKEPAPLAARVGHIRGIDETIKPIHAPGAGRND